MVIHAHRRHAVRTVPTVSRKTSMVVTFVSAQKLHVNGESDTTAKEDLTQISEDLIQSQGVTLLAKIKVAMV